MNAAFHSALVGRVTRTHQGGKNMGARAMSKIFRKHLMKERWNKWHLHVRQLRFSIHVEIRTLTELERTSSSNRSNRSTSRSNSNYRSSPDTNGEYYSPSSIPSTTRKLLLMSIHHVVLSISMTLFCTALMDYHLCNEQRH